MTKIFYDNKYYIKKLFILNTKICFYRKFIIFAKLQN